MQRNGNEGSKRHAEPQDRLGEQRGSALTIDQTLDQFHCQIAKTDGAGKHTYVACVVLALLEADANCTGKGAEQGYRATEPRKGKVAVSARCLHAKNR